MENNIATINQGRPVYFSYARNSSRKPEWEHISDCVDPLLNTLTANGLEYRVDVKDIGMGDKISKFEEEIGWNSEVVVIIFSDKYFRSMHCMYEFVQIKRALETYPEKRLMCIKSGDFNLSDVNYISDLERYWGNQKFEYENIEYHRLREHSGTEIAAYENGFYLDDIRKLYSFFSAINYSNANSINYDGFVGDIVRYYKTTRKPKLTPKPKVQQLAKIERQTASASQPKTKKSPAIPIVIGVIAAVSLVIYLMMGNTMTTVQTAKTTEQTVSPTKQLAATTEQPAATSNTDNDGSVTAIVTTPDDNTTNIDDIEHTYVDLGLPSGTLWATCNIGANSPEEYGDYLAWGETKPKTERYDWDTYTYHHNPKKLPPSCDAATVNWGSDWCMPTREQFEELVNNCTWTWIASNENNGCEVKGTNGNFIFLPAGGGIVGFDFGDEDSVGVYWSSSLNDDEPWVLGFVSDDRWVYQKPPRYGGLPVRPVRCK